MTMASREFVIVNKKGLHARASAQFVGAVVPMEGVRVTVIKDGTRADGGSILDLMMLGAGLGSTVVLEVEGNDAQARLEELGVLIDSGFGEN